MTLLAIGPSVETSGAIALTYVDLIIASGLVIAAGVVSLLLKLGLERRLAIAAIRTVLQLMLVGYVLRFVFGLATWWAVAAVVAVMLSFAADAAIRRPSRTVRRAFWLALGTLTISSLITSYIVTGLVVGSEPWFAPRYLIPLLGMILGNGLTGISLCIDQMLEYLATRRGEIETELALGASRWEAANKPLRESVRRGMIPIINSMSVVGIVALPGMMTGQILQGADPVAAVQYQIVVMFMIAGATSTCCMMIALILYRMLFSNEHQLLSGRIKQR